MLNNKGQSLVLFVVVLPILLLVLVLVIDIGRVICLKLELDNVNKLVLDYGLDNLDNENVSDELIKLVKMNNDKIYVIDIFVSNNKIYIRLNSDFNVMLCGLIDISIFDVESYYVGYIDGNEKRLEKVNGWLVWILL